MCDIPFDTLIINESRLDGTVNGISLTSKANHRNHEGGCDETLLP